MDNKKSELEMSNGREELNITLEDCFEKEQKENNVHIVVAFDNAPGLINAVTRFEKQAKGNIINLDLNQGVENDERNIHFNLVDAAALGLSDGGKINLHVVNCVRYLQCKLDCV